jgi:hypothetical protein
VLTAFLFHLAFYLFKTLSRSILHLKKNRLYP